MKYFVEVAVTPEAGKVIEARPGGPGPVIGRILERFKPEAVYFTCSERTMLMFVDLPKPEDITELMIAGADISGEYPAFTPVVTGKEFPELVGKAVPAAQKLTEG